MPDIDLLAVLTATAAAFVSSAVYYVVLSDQLAGVSAAAAAAAERPPPWEIGAELLRTLVLTAVVAGLASETGADDWTGGLLLGIALWIGFPLVLWVGAMLHERTPWKLAAIHAGDWLLKLPVVAVVVSVW